MGRSRSTTGTGPAIGRAETGIAISGTVRHRQERPVSGLLFDFDFTLADSLPGIVACANHALDRLQRLAASVEEIRHTVGLPLIESAGALGIEGARDRESYREVFLEHAARVMTDATRIYDGVPELLSGLEEILVRNAVRHRFGSVIGGDDVEHPKPHPEALVRGLAELDVPPSGAVYVGDHVIDAETARAAGVPFIAVLTGVHDGSAFRPFRPRAVLDTVCHLREYVGCPSRPRVAE